MKFKIQFKLKEDLDFRQKPEFFHKIFRTALLHERNDFAYRVPRYKTLYKDREYTLLFISENQEIISKILNLKTNKMDITHLSLINNTFDNFKKIKLNQLIYRMSNQLAKAKGIDTVIKGKEVQQLNFHSKFHKIDTLKELMEYEITKKINQINPILKENQHGVLKFADLIEDIEIIDNYYIEIKNGKIPAVDVLISLKDLGRHTALIGNYILNNGLGSNTSYGSGFAEQGV